MNGEILDAKSQIYSTAEVPTGKMWTTSGKSYPIYRKVIMGLSLHTGANNISHKISNMWFPLRVYGGMTLKNGNFEIFPESCCDNIIKYGISIRDINKTYLTILLGNGYIGDLSPNQGEGHVIIEYIEC